MIKQIRTSKFTKVVAWYLIIMIFLESTSSLGVYALTGGPAQPEFNSFTPISTSDMVDLSSGDLNYNIPIMDVGGYPLNLAYNSGVTMDQEASWVGLGWDLGVGQIARQVRGIPDDFNGDQIRYENNMKDNTTIGGNVNVFVAPFGTLENLSGSFGLGIKYNNYNGLGFSVNGGLSYQIQQNMSVGMNLESSSTDGVSVSPSVSFHNKYTDSKGRDNNMSLSYGVSMNNRKGVETVTMSASRTRVATKGVKEVKNDKGEVTTAGVTERSASGSMGATVSFVDSDFTPSKRVGMSSSNTMFNLNLEGAIWGIDPGVKFSGYRNIQGIKASEKDKYEKAFGYENTYNASYSDILDYNREKDRTVNKSTVSLPVTNYTHDLYSIQGQGVSGMFRPYSGQVGYVYDNYTRDDSNGNTLGGEIGAGGGTHFGVDFARTDTKSSSGLWQNDAYFRFLEKKTGNLPNYEKVFFKNIGGTHVDKDMGELFYNNTNTSKLGGYSPVSFAIAGSSYSRNLSSVYYDKLLINPIYAGPSPYIKREQHRLNRNQTIQKLTREEAAKYGSTTFSPYTNKKTHKHHTSEVRIIKSGGDVYTYGRAAYNIVKKEVTFDVSQKDNPYPNVDRKKNLVYYSSQNGDNSPNNHKDGDQYFNRITTPGYAHSYLLTSVLSSDFQDIDNVKGPSDGDLGTYTKFSYTNKTAKSPYKWRVPYAENKANFDEGLMSLNKDNKGNYQYGEKEMLYVNKIETKTHVAIFHISPRNDGYGVKGENGGMDTSESSKMWKLDKISLYSKPEYLAHKDNLEEATPIKEAHFEYSYSLCKNIPNNIEYNNTNDSGPGKLTLKKVYFTYQNSKMGKYTPYEFDYDENNPLSNPNYDQKGYDIWGNYKKSPTNVNDLSNAEYPYVAQENKTQADEYASAWLLRSIKLPSGGDLKVTYESDDYKYVQNREAMQMFKVVGAGNDINTLSTGNRLYQNANSQTNVVYIKLDTPCSSDSEFLTKYLNKLKSNPIYFRFLLNMTRPSLSDRQDYVTGYMRLHLEDGNPVYKILENGQYAAIQIELDGGHNPIAKAGWNFGKQYLSNVVYNLTGDEGLDVTNVEGVVKSIIDLIPNLVNIFRSPNAELIDGRIASRFDTTKSWIRLMAPSAKFGSGSRVKELKIQDNWNVMTDNLLNTDYSQLYGQEYSYTKEDGTSSGVATYEPLGGKENPFVEPFYDRAHSEALLGPDSQNYVEMPFGESFFPSPKVTYGRVSVKNLQRVNGNIKVKKHATGKVVTEFFTSYDYPTISDISKISPRYDNSDLASILNINVRTHLALAQGFAIHTNDMDGKMKSQWVYAEDQKDPISGVEYKYDPLNATDPNRGRLNNEVITIDSKGVIGKNIVGVDYDVINDFRINETDTSTKGIHFNTEGLPLFMIFVIVPAPIPSYMHHEEILKTATTTKVIHSTGILRETIAYDAGSVVSTKNLAWDADTGEVLLTETVNEYNENYYNFNFPAYWANEGMAQTALNLGLEWGVENIGTKNFKLSNSGTSNHVESDYLIDGDELWITSTEPKDKKGYKAWAVNVSGSDFNLIDSKGMIINNTKLINGRLKIIKSGHRNLQSANMASVTLMKSPIYVYGANNTVVLDGNGLPSLKQKLYPTTGPNDGVPFITDNWNDFRIINASAVEYKNEWAAQCECGLPKMVFDNNGKLIFEYKLDSNDDIDVIQKRSYNPYRYNVLGNWRASKSYAYLTGRNKEDDPTPRKTGFFKNFRPFYVFDATKNKWRIITGTDYERWTYASEVTQFNPYGQELENKDALDRYSSALHGYNNRFPIAVASNTKYSELAFDGFEDYDFSNCTTKSHFDFNETLQKNEVSITNKQSHTGKKSIRLEPGKKATIGKKIKSCVPTVTPPSGKNAKPVVVNKIKAGKK